MNALAVDHPLPRKFATVYIHLLAFRFEGRSPLSPPGKSSYVDVVFSQCADRRSNTRALQLSYREHSQQQHKVRQ